MRKLACILVVLATPVWADMQTARDAFQAGQFDKALENLRPAAQSGNAEAEFLLGNIYGLGLGVVRDGVRGFEWHHRAAMKGHPAAQLRVSRAFAAGKGTSADPLRALLWARLAVIGKADGAAQIAQTLQRQMTQEQLQTVEKLVEDYRLYLFPFSDP